MHGVGSLAPLRRDVVATAGRVVDEDERAGAERREDRLQLAHAVLGGRQRRGEFDVVAVEVDDVDLLTWMVAHPAGQVSDAVVAHQRRVRPDQATQPLARLLAQIDRPEAPAEGAHVGVPQPGRVRSPGRRAGLQDGLRASAHEGQQIPHRRVVHVLEVAARREVVVAERHGVGVATPAPGDQRIVALVERANRFPCHHRGAILVLHRGVQLAVQRLVAIGDRVPRVALAPGGPGSHAHLAPAPRIGQERVDRRRHIGRASAHEAVSP
jgi:hypothetical protein